MNVMNLQFGKMFSLSVVKKKLFGKTAWVNESFTSVKEELGYCNCWTHLRRKPKDFLVIARICKS